MSKIIRLKIKGRDYDFPYELFSLPDILTLLAKELEGVDIVAYEFSEGNVRLPEKDRKWLVLKARKGGEWKSVETKTLAQQVEEAIERAEPSFQAAVRELAFGDYSPNTSRHEKKEALVKPKQIDEEAAKAADTFFKKGGYWASGPGAALVYLKLEPTFRDIYIQGFRAGAWVVSVLPKETENE